MRKLNEEKAAVPCVDIALLQRAAIKSVRKALSSGLFAAANRSVKAYLARKSLASLGTYQLLFYPCRCAENFCAECFIALSCPSDLRAAFETIVAFDGPDPTPCGILTATAVEE